MFEHEYIGNLHIHSSYSDGVYSVAEIAGSAVKAGLDFICINDHDFMTPDLHLREEGFYGRLLVLMGLEIGKRHHHYLAYDLKEMIKGDDLGPQEVIDQVHAQGGFGFLAHPFERGMPFRDKSVAFTWKDRSVQNFTGIDLWNFSSRWKERVKSVFHGLFFLMFPHQTLKGPSKETLYFWDDLCQERRVAALGGSDAHASQFRWGPIRLRPFTYEYLLGTINVHVLLHKYMPLDFKEAKEEVYEAIREGHLFIAHDGLCPAKGFRFDFVADDGSNLFMGEEGNFHEGNLVVELPYPGEIRLMKDGSPLQKWQGMEAAFRVTEKGIYRVEVYRRLSFFGWRPWIFSNPIYLR
jgi:hypothetical protein